MPGGGPDTQTLLLERFDGTPVFHWKGLSLHSSEYVIPLWQSIVMALPLQKLYGNFLLPREEKSRRTFYSSVRLDFIIHLKTNFFSPFNKAGFAVL